MGRLIGDLRYALRSAGRNPGFALTVVLILALGIGATTAMFGIVRGVLLRPLDYAESNRLVMGFGAFRLNNAASVSPPDYLDYRDQVDGFDSLAAAMSGTNLFNLAGNAGAERVTGRLVTANYFATLGATPTVGRHFREDEASVEGARVVMLSHGLWQRRFGGDPAVVGSAIRVDGEPHTVVGVMPARFYSPAGAELWAPLRFGESFMTVRRFHFLRAIGRLAEGQSLASVQAQADVVAERLEAAFPASNETWRLRLVPMRTALTGGARTPLFVLLGAVGLVLLIACANVASLQLARASARRREIAVRYALGASRGTVLRQLLTESACLAAAGGIAGTALAYFGIDALRTFAPANLPRLDELALDGPVLAFAAGAALLTGLLFGLAPALHTSIVSLADALRGAGRDTGGAAGIRLRSSMVTAQVALSAVLLIGAGLLLQSFWRLERVDPGFAPDGVLRATVTLPMAQYEDAAQRAAFFEQLENDLAASPGVVAAGAIDILPLGGGGNDTAVHVAGEPPADPSQVLHANLRRVTPGFFRAMRVPLQQGRWFAAGDREGAPATVVIDQAMARQSFGDADAVGRRLVVDLGEPWEAEVVGVVGDVQMFNLSTPSGATLYLPVAQRTGSDMQVVVRTDGKPEAFVSALRERVGALDAEVPLSHVGTMAGLVRGSTAQPRFRATLLMLFAGAAVLLAAIGLYGVLAFLVQQRRRELGIRVALGATARDIVGLVVRRGMRLVAIGLGVGLLASFALTRLMAGLLFGVGATHLPTFALMTALLFGVTLATCWLPARRAARTDAIVALRQD